MWERVSGASDISEHSGKIFLGNYCLGSSMRDEWILFSKYIEARRNSVCPDLRVRDDLGIFKKVKVHRWW